MEVSAQLHAPPILSPGERARVALWIGGWVGLRAGLDDVDKRKLFPLPGIGPRPLSPQSRRYTDSAMSTPLFNIQNVKCISL
jgi:hypothetical protein